MLYLREDALLQLTVQEDTFHLGGKGVVAGMGKLVSQKAEGEQAVKMGYKTSRPVTRDPLLPGSSNSLRFHNLPK